MHRTSFIAAGDDADSKRNASANLHMHDWCSVVNKLVRSKYVDNSKCRLRLYQSTVAPKRTEQTHWYRCEAKVTNNALENCTVEAAIAELFFLVNLCVVACVCQQFAVLSGKDDSTAPLRDCTGDCTVGSWLGSVHPFSSHLISVQFRLPQCTPSSSVCHSASSAIAFISHKKLCYRREVARCFVSVSSLTSTVSSALQSFF